MLCHTPNFCLEVCRFDETNEARQDTFYFPLRDECTNRYHPDPGGFEFGYLTAVNYLGFFVNALSSHLVFADKKAGRRQTHLYLCLHAKRLPIATTAHRVVEHSKCF